MEREPLDALEDEMADFNPPVGLVVTEEDNGSIEVTDVGGGEIDDEHAIALLLRGLILMLGPTIFQVLETMDEEDNEEDT